MSDDFFKTYNPESRRCKVLRIPQNTILNLLFPPKEINAVYKIDLPEDVRVIRTWPDHEYSAIAFLLESESFEEVQEGRRTPELEFLGVEIVKYKVEPVNETSNL